MGGDALTPEEKAEYEQMLEKVDWNLPGMEVFGEDSLRWIKRSILDEDIVNAIACLGWGFWPTKNRGYYDEHSLRKIADFIEIQNKPFWDEYERYCDDE